MDTPIKQFTKVYLSVGGKLMWTQGLSSEYLTTVQYKERSEASDALQAMLDVLDVGEMKSFDDQTSYIRTPDKIEGKTDREYAPVPAMHW